MHETLADARRPILLSVDLPPLRRQRHQSRDSLGLRFHLINTLNHSAHNVEALDEPDPSSWNVELRYPSGFAERFSLRRQMRLSRRAKSACSLEPLDDLFRTIQVIFQYSACSGDLFGNIRLRLRLAWEHDSLRVFEEAIAFINEHVQSNPPTFLPHGDQIRRLPSELVHHFFDQLYDRAVSPHLNGLKQGRSENVYGEIRPVFLSQIFRQLRLTQDSTFLDLGSGVGNTVMQAALETGCEAHGIERARYPHLTGAYHLQQFHARAALWGLHSGQVTLHFGDFLKSRLITSILAEADVVMINNVKFEPQTDEKLYELFAKTLKVGTRIFSMKALTPARRGRGSGSTIATVDGLFQTETATYDEGMVSWTDRSGVYYVSTKLRHSPCLNVEQLI